MTQGHSIFEFSDGRRACSCGQRFSNPLAALDHALPLNTRSLADAVAADPKSTPDMIARSEATAQEAARIARREGK